MTLMVAVGNCCNFFLRIFPSLSLWKVSWQFEHDKSSHFYSKTSIFIQEIHMNIKVLEMEEMKISWLNYLISDVKREI